MNHVQNCNFPTLTIRGVYEIIISRLEESKLFAFNDEFEIHAIR